MEHNLNELNNMTADQIFIRTRTKLSTAGFYADNCEFRFHDITGGVKKPKEIRLRCRFHNDGCKARIFLTVQGCREYLCQLPHTFGNVRMKGNHTIASHKKRKDKNKYFFPVITGSQRVKNEEIDNLILNQGKGQGQIMKELFSRITYENRKIVRKQVINRINSLKGNQNNTDFLGNMEPITMNRRPTPYCRADYSFVSDGYQGRCVIFGTADQFDLLTENDNRIIVVDGFFKLKIKGFKQLITFAVFTNRNVYVPIAHILLTDKKEMSYIQAFNQMITIANTDTNWMINWSEKQVISDYERGLANAISRVFPNSVINKCYFHFTKAIYDNFNDKVPVSLQEYPSEFLTDLKTYPFSLKVEQEFGIPREIIAAGLFYINYGTNRAILPFLRYFQAQWLNESFIFDESEVALQRTTNGAECIHEQFRQLGLVNTGRIDDLVEKLIEIDFVLYRSGTARKGERNNDAWTSVSGADVLEETRVVFQYVIDTFREEFLVELTDLLPNGMLSLVEQLEQLGNDDSEDEELMNEEMEDGNNYIDEEI